MDRDSREGRPSAAPYLFTVSLLVGLVFGTDVRAQAPGQGGSTAPKPGAAAAKGDRKGAKAAGAAKAQAKARKGPSEDYQESIRATVERRRQRRARRGQGLTGSVPAGAIVPWPMPPALIIRHTRETHDEIEGFLSLIRR